MNPHLSVSKRSSTEQSLRGQKLHEKVGNARSKELLLSAGSRQKHTPVGAEAQSAWYLVDENSGAWEHRQVKTEKQGGPTEFPFLRFQSPWLPVLSHPVVLDFRLASTSEKEGNASRAVHLRRPLHRGPCSNTG